MGERSPCRYTCGRHHVTPALPDTAAQPPPIAPLSPHQRYEAEAVRPDGRRLQAECQKEQDGGSPAARHGIGRHSAFPRRRRHVELSLHRLRARTDSFRELTGSTTAGSRQPVLPVKATDDPPPGPPSTSQPPRAVRVGSEATEPGRAGSGRAGSGRVGWFLREACALHGMRLPPGTGMPRKP